MTNEDIVKAVEAFVVWDDEDKKKVVSAIRDGAIRNMMWWLSQTSEGEYFMRIHSPARERRVSQDEIDRSKPDGWSYID
jgi:hypothetical protein